MKTVHFATSFLLSVVGRYRDLKLLNKAAVLKAVPKTPDDPYTTENLACQLRSMTPSPLGPAITDSDLTILRNHLAGTYNNDGAALAAGYAPYSTFGFDFSTPSAEYLANRSKNHGHAGAFVWAVLDATDAGREAIANAERIVCGSDPPAAALGRPLIPGNDEEMPPIASLLPSSMSEPKLVEVAAAMNDQTKAVQALTASLAVRQGAYALRHLVIGVGCWLLLYLLKHAAGDSVIVFPDYTEGRSRRVRHQARSCYGRHLSGFGSLVAGLDGGTPASGADSGDVLWDARGARLTRDLEEHLNDISLRLGWIQPRASAVRVKHYEIVPDTLRVLLLSILPDDEVLTMEEVAARLFESWRICLGVRSTDHGTLREHGYVPLDEDADLQQNRSGFKRLAIALGLAEEPSDGLVLFKAPSVGAE